MEEKKRWRPSLAEYRALQKEIDGHMEDKSRLVADCDAWREKYHQLKKEYDKLNCSDVGIAEKSNRLMEEELTRVRKQAEDASKDYNNARREVLWLRNRSLWQRIINKQFDE